MYRFESALPLTFRFRSAVQAEPTRSVLSDDPEQRLWQAVAEGDVSALRDIYRSHNAKVRAFAQRLLGDVAAAEDLVQEVFIAVPKAARSFRFETTPASYLLGMAARCASKHIRASKRRRAAGERLSQLPPSPIVALDDQVHADRVIELLMQAVDQLPDKLRIVFVLCQVEERNATEVGTILDIPPATVRSRLRAAREQLQEATPWFTEARGE